MLFSEAFDLTPTKRDDWFDPILDTDTPLFVDPFLIFKDLDPEWAGAHEQLVRHFDTCFQLIAQGNRNRRSVPYKKALRLLTFPEPKEICLGCTPSSSSSLPSAPAQAKPHATKSRAAVFPSPPARYMRCMPVGPPLRRAGRRCTSRSQPGSAGFECLVTGTRRSLC